MYGLGVLAGVYVADPSFSDVETLILAFLTALLFQASTFALNDYFDYEVDVANRRLDRPLVRGDIERIRALQISLILFPLGCITSYKISPQAFAFAFAVSILGVAYNVKLKEFGLAGNVYIAFSMSAPFLFGSIVATSKIVGTSAIMAAIAFLSGLGREIMKGIEDVKGDALRNVRSVARVKGEEFAAKAAAALYISAVALSPLPLIYEEYVDVKYVFPVAVCDALILSAAVRLLRDFENIPELRRRTLIAMFFGLVAFLAGAF